MINTENVKALLEVIAGLDSEELERYSDIIDTCVAQLDRVAGYDEETAELAELYAAAKLNYRIALIENSTDRITSFSAGDISISEGGTDRISTAKELLNTVEADCEDIFGVSGFVFEAV